MSPIYPKLREAGAVFGQVMGYERPTHFDRDSWEERLPDGSRPYKIAETNTFGKPAWFDLVASEYSACREAIGFSDYSSFTKLELWVWMWFNNRVEFYVGRAIQQEWKINTYFSR